MSWSKLKTIIIFILLCVNLFLLCLVAFLQFHSAQYEASALSAALAVLEGNGVEVHIDDLPSGMDLPTLSLSRATDREREMAEILLGTEQAGDSTRVSFLNNGKFSINLLPPLAAPQGTTPLEHAKSLLADMGVEIWQAVQSDDNVVVIQSLNGVPVFSSDLSTPGVTFVYNENHCLTTVGGRLLLGTTTQVAESRKPVSMATVLLTFANTTSQWLDVYRSIDSIEAVYLVEIIPTLADPIQLTPVWRIVTDTGEYCLDPYTSEVTRITPITQISPKARPSVR